MKLSVWWGLELSPENPERQFGKFLHERKEEVKQFEIPKTILLQRMVELVRQKVAVAPT